MLDYKKAHELFRYNPETGEFLAKKDRLKWKEGKPVGYKEVAGYMCFHYYGKTYKIHRVVFLMQEGYWPEHEIDHINGVRDDNRWCNLRHVSKTCNLQNQKRYKNNRTGIPGVGYNRGKIRARGRVNGQLFDLGYYPSLLEAALARYTWEQFCSGWTCNKRSVLVSAIIEMWPGFITNTTKR